MSLCPLKQVNTIRTDPEIFLISIFEIFLRTDEVFIAIVIFEVDGSFPGRQNVPPRRFTCQKKRTIPQARHMAPCTATSLL